MKVKYTKRFNEDKKELLLPSESTQKIVLGSLHCSPSLILCELFSVTKVFFHGFEYSIYSLGVFALETQSKMALRRRVAT